MDVPARKVSMTISEDATITRRIEGYDFARALAVFGMVIVNFKTVMGAAKSGPHWLLVVTGLCDGRAAALFVVLAGVGISLMSQSARVAKDAGRLAVHRRDLYKRSLLLFIVGTLYLPIWPADILHFYGIYIAIGACLLTVSNRTLWILAVAFVMTFDVLVMLLDYEKGWNWETLDYRGYWTIGGMVRNLFFNGFHPVFPWTAFLLIGMVIGRLDMRSPQVRRRVLYWGMTAVIISEGLSWLLIRTLSVGASASEQVELAVVLGTSPMPPLPFYMAAGAGTAVVVVVACIALTERFPNSPWLQPFVTTGRLALTLYVAHVVLGMGVLESLGRLENQSVVFAVSSASVFCVLAFSFSYLWSRRFKQGPLEWLMRRMAAR